MEVDRYYLNMAHSVALESHCQRRKVGAILVVDNGKIILTAVNDPLPYNSICEEYGCLRIQESIESGTCIHKCRCIHSEKSLILQCAEKGISAENAVVYTTLSPCANCAVALIDAGIKRVVCWEEYTDKKGIELLKQANISVELYDSIF